MNPAEAQALATPSALAPTLDTAPEPAINAVQTPKIVAGRKARVVLVDDHPVILAGLRSIVQSDPGMEFIGQAMTGAAALNLIRDKQPDVAVIDITLPGINGIALTKRLTQECPSVRVLILTAHEERAYVRQAFEAGVRGYLLKRSALENLPNAVRGVFVGGLYVDPAVADYMFEFNRRATGRNPAKSTFQELTGREMEVLKRTALGQTNKEIARDLDLSVNSVETYRARGSGKLGLGTRADIVRYAALQGWLVGI